MRTPSSRLAALLALVLLLPLAGCRSGSALHSRYNNFRAYYNTYYNASRKLDEGERALLNVNTPIDRAALVPLFPTGTATSGRTPAFQAAIEKSAELLRNRPTSAWADDALLVIGKAFFYERNLAGAEQKFRETIEAAEINGNRGLSDEARFWLGRTLAAADRFEEGIGALREGIERPGGTRFWTARMHLGLGELYARAERWDEAAAALREGLPGVRDADLGGRAGLLLGQAEEAAGRFDAAAEAYADVLRRGPAYEIAFAAELSRALVLGLDAGRAPEALDALRRMARDDKNFARRAEVALAQGRVLAAAADRDAARSVLTDVLYDPDLAGQAVRGEAHVRLAELYRDAFGDFVRAAAHFDTAATALGARAVGTAPPSRAALTGVRQTAQTFALVARASTRIADVDSLLALGQLDEAAFRARIEEIEQARRVAWVAEQRQIAALQAAQDFAGTTVPGFSQGAPGNARPDGREGLAPGTPGGNAAIGFLGFRDPTTLQNGQIAFARVWGDRPLVPNWRRAAAVQAITALADGGGAAAAAAVAGPRALGPPRLDLTGVPRTPEQQATLAAERAALRYELGNAFFLSLGRTDLARSLYQRILDETPDEPVAVRARYALGEIDVAEGRTGDAEAHFREVVRADSVGALARAARARLDGTEPAPAPAVLADTAEVAFVGARTLWDRGEPLLAAAEFVRLGDAAPAAALAPRAFLAAALAIVDAARGDTLVLLEPLRPDLVPDTLATEEAAAAPTEEASAPIRFDDAPATRGSPRQPGAARATSARTPVDTDPPPPVSPSRPDSVATPGPLASPDSLSSPADSAAAPSGTPTVRELLLRLARTYPGTPAAARASALAAALPLPPPDPADALAPGPAAPDPPAADSLAALLPDDLDPAEAAAPFGLRGDQPVDASLGGVTVRLTVYSSLEDAQTEVAIARAARLRYALHANDSEGTVSVVVGQFLTEAEAIEAFPRIPPELLEEAQVVSVAGLTLLPAPADGTP